MQLNATAEAHGLPALLRGEAQLLRAWTERWSNAPVALCLGAILIGAGLYGATIGSWRSPLQAMFVALKLPLIILLTTAGNALLNSMLAPLLGLRITVRQSMLALLMSFAIACAILGSFSPLIAFAVWNSPPLEPDLQVSGGAYSFILLSHVGVIAFAGVAGNLRLAQFLREISPKPAIGRRVLFAWLATNLFVGSQLAWILRPFIGSPTLPVEFLRASAFKGNFYESVLNAFLRLLNWT